MKTVAFIGLGLIGGSIARSMKKFHPDYRILAYNRTRERLIAALQDGVIDGILEEHDARYAECDYIFLCAPVEYNLVLLSYLKDIISESCIVTDVGSVKGIIHDYIDEIGMNKNFIGGHPMAGSEKTGYENGSDRMIENAYYMITPGREVTQKQVDEFSELVASMGSIPMIMDPDKHDYITSAVSHLPHLIASSLVNLVKEKDDAYQHMKTIAAGGFKDITRIASSSPVMWEQICAENGEHITEMLDSYIASLQEIREKVSQKQTDYIHDMFVSSRDYRDSIDAHVSGPIDQSHYLYCDIADETGAIATIAIILAMQQINIKNIGIIHNREFEQGALKIAFYDEISCVKAEALLTKRNYIIYKPRA